MAKLTKESRDSLPEHDFAVPGKRELPIHDETHTRMTWGTISKTKDLSPAERKEARRRVIERAKHFGIDTKEWGKLSASAVTLSAMALNIATDDHPNKMPFRGIMTRIDQPSDVAPEGSDGRLITISAEAAEKGLASLLGMAVDYKPGLDGHDPKAKIGIITAATIEGDAIAIEGFIYAADFPEVAAEIKASKDLLGFSYEARNLYTNDPDANPCVITDCTFTGAAILLKAKAAYRTTSIAAAAEGDETMTPELEKMLKDLTDGLGTLTAGFATLSASVAEIKKGPEKVEANANTMALVEPHAKALESCAAGMDAAGVGGHPERGHAVMARKMAGHMRAAAAMGQIPHIYRDHDYFVNAAADKDASADLSTKVEALMKPIADKLAALGTQLADVKAAAAKDSKAPERKTLKPEITALLAKHSIEVPTEGDKIDLGKLDASLKAANMTVEQRLNVKTALRQGGLLA